VLRPKTTPRSSSKSDRRAHRTQRARSTL
jgi:hypothetical protein